MTTSSLADDVYPPDDEPDGVGAVVHLLNDEYDVRIDRATRWGNPFLMNDESDRTAVIASYRKWVLTSDSLAADWIRRHVHQLRGKRLGCWCAPRPCHGDVLLELAERTELK